MYSNNQVHTEKKKRHIGRYIVLGILGLILLSLIFGRGESGKKNATQVRNSYDAQYEQANKKSAKIGEAVRDGKFEFIVQGIQCGQTSISDNPYIKKDAQGQFCIVTMSVKNIASEPKTLAVSSQKLFDDQNREFAPDTTASLYIAKGVSYENINPGNKLDVSVAFDVSKETIPASIALHDDVLSSGVKVSLK